MLELAGQWYRILAEDGRSTGFAHDGLVEAKLGELSRASVQR